MTLAANGRVSSRLRPVLRTLLSLQRPASRHANQEERTVWLSPAAAMHIRRTLYWRCGPLSRIAIDNNVAFSWYCLFRDSGTARAALFGRACTTVRVAGRAVRRRGNGTCAARRTACPPRTFTSLVVLRHIGHRLGKSTALNRWNNVAQRNAPALVTASRGARTRRCDVIVRRGGRAGVRAAFSGRGAVLAGDAHAGAVV